jgi:L-cysteine desulfidase
MNILEDVLAHEVYPALGCTEPTACAHAAAVAAAELGEPALRVRMVTDPGTYKNGVAVVVPHSGGRTGNLIAAILGACVARPETRLEVLAHVTDEIRERADRILAAGESTNVSAPSDSGFRVDVTVDSAHHSARAVLGGSHTFVERIEKDGEVVLESSAEDNAGALGYRDTLRTLGFAEILTVADHLEPEQIELLRSSIAMNLDMAKRGMDCGGTAGQLRRIQEDGHLAEDMFFRAKILVAAAVDARMAGVDLAVMTSGGSGNQGILTALTLHGVGTEMGVDEAIILKSIAVAHVINSYIKCYVGELAVICGCAISAGIAVAAGIVFQQAGPDIPKITHAVNNVIGDLSGLICDGAKPGCAMKAISSVDSSMRSALMALGGFGLDTDEGVVGRTVEDSIRNLGRVTLEGMFGVDPTVIDILHEKAVGRGLA